MNLVPQDSDWAVPPATLPQGDRVAFGELIGLGTFEIEVEGCSGECDVCWG